MQREEKICQELWPPEIICAEKDWEEVVGSLCEMNERRRRHEQLRRERPPAVERLETDDRRRRRSNLRLFRVTTRRLAAREE